VIDRRQCVLFCHDASRYCLFLPGVRAPQFEELGRWHRDLLLASLAAEGVEEGLLATLERALGPPHFDTATDRSVLSSMNVARGDLDGMLMRVGNVLDLDPLFVARRLNERPAMAGRVLHWPALEMLQRIRG
jgi:hypothetical protein